LTMHQLLSPRSAPLLTALRRRGINLHRKHQCRAEQRYQHGRVRAVASSSSHAVLSSTLILPRVHSRPFEKRCRGLVPPVLLAAICRPQDGVPVATPAPCAARPLAYRPRGEMPAAPACASWQLQCRQHHRPLRRLQRLPKPCRRHRRLAQQHSPSISARCAKCSRCSSTSRRHGDSLRQPVRVRLQRQMPTSAYITRTRCSRH